MSFRHSIPLLLIISLTLAGGALAGVLANRWGPPADMLGAGADLAKVPLEFGDWRLDTETPLNDDEIEMLGCTGQVSRSYLNRATGDMVSVAIIVGPPGRISVHTPEICYTAQGDRQTGRRERVTVPLGGEGTLGGEGSLGGEEPLGGKGGAEFWRVPFVLESRGGAKLAAYYGWCDGGPWSAPAWPRFAYGGRPYLYKIQLNAPLLPGRGGEQRDAGRSFLADFIPALKREGIPAGAEIGGEQPADRSHHAGP